jgi:hypothetical protein
LDAKRESETKRRRKKRRKPYLNNAPKEGKHICIEAS